MRVLSIGAFLLLTGISALHLYWGFGGLWPGADTQSLVDTVIGDPRATRIPGIGLTGAVAGLIFASGVFALLSPRRIGRIADFIIASALVVIACVFLARGASGYLLPDAIRSQLSEPFATLDRIFYSPLCLALGAIFVALFVARSRAKSK